MPYRHFGNIGDVWKHLPLCEILAIEQPKVYVETNAAYAQYTLQGTPRQQYGVGHLYAYADDADAVAGSHYVQHLKAANHSAAEPHIYLGSCALAMHMLRDTARRFIICDIEAEALESNAAYAKALGLDATVETVLGDSIAGTLGLLPELSDDTFLHIDPYHIFEPNDAGQTYFDVFLAATRRGLRCMLWYGYFTGDEQAALIGRIRADLVADARVSLDQIHGVDVWLDSLAPDRIVANPGVVGCGVLTGNLSRDSRDAVDALAAGLVHVYAGARFEDAPRAIQVCSVVRH